MCNKNDNTDYLHSQSVIQVVDLVIVSSTCVNAITIIVHVSHPPPLLHCTEQTHQTDQYVAYKKVWLT